MTWSHPMLAMATNTYWGNRWLSAPLRLTCQFASQLLRLYCPGWSCAQSFHSYRNLSHFLVHHIEWTQIKGNSHYVVCPSHISYNFWLSSDRIWVVISIKNHFSRFSRSFSLSLTLIVNQSRNLIKSIAIQQGCCLVFFSPVLPICLYSLEGHSLR